LHEQGIISNFILSRVLRFYGIGEAQLEADIEDLIDSQTNPSIAPLAGDGEVTLRLTAKSKTEKESEKLLDEMEKESIKEQKREKLAFTTRRASSTENL